VSDTWICPQCKAQLRCSCQSMECGFDYDIKDHVRNHLVKAVEYALDWMEPKSVMNITERTIQDKEEPCCHSCEDNK